MIYLIVRLAVTPVAKDIAGGHEAHPDADTSARHPTTKNEFKIIADCCYW